MQRCYEQIIDASFFSSASKAIDELDAIRKSRLTISGFNPWRLQQIYNAWSQEILMVIKDFGDRGDTFKRLSELAAAYPTSLALEDIIRIYSLNIDQIKLMKYTVIGGGFGVGAVMGYIPTPERR